MKTTNNRNRPFGIRTRRTFISIAPANRVTVGRLAVGRRIVGLTMLLCTTVLGHAAAQVAGVDGDNFLF